MVKCFFAFPDRALLRLSGPDKASFLQGLITNDVNLISGNAALYACLLTAQGKFLHDFFIIESGDDWLIDCEKGPHTELLKTLLRYRLRSRVTLSDDSDDYQVLGSLENPDISRFPSSYLFYPDPRDKRLGWRILAPAGEVFSFSEDQWEHYEMTRIRQRIPDGRRDMIPEKSLIMEFGLDRLNGIDFNKGCYMGQEMTSRMFFRDLIKKQLFHVCFGHEAPPAGTPVMLDGKEIGDMRSHCKQDGLALLRREAVADIGAAVCAGHSFTLIK